MTTDCSILAQEIPWTSQARQAPLSMGFPRQEYWSKLPFPSPRVLPYPGMEPTSPALAGEFFTTEPPGKPRLRQSVNQELKESWNLINWILKKWSEVSQSSLTLCDPIDCSLPDSSIHGIFQARVLEWVAISFSRGSSLPRDWTWISRIVGRCFPWATREALWFLLICKSYFDLLWL